MTPPPTSSLGRTRAVDLALTAEQEERLAVLVDELSERRGDSAQAALEEMAATHPDLSGQLREVFATMLVTDAVARESVVFESRGAADPTTRVDGSVPSAPANHSSAAPHSSPANRSSAALLRRAHDDVLDGGRIDTAPLDDAPHDGRGELVAADLAKEPALGMRAADRRADAGDDDRRRLG